MRLTHLFRKALVLWIVSLFLGGNWMMVLSGNVSVLAAGATIYVDDDNIDAPWDGTPANPFQYIQDGINAASAGDTVHVLGGTYFENVVLNKSIILEGESKPVINGMGGIGINATMDDGFAYGVTVDGFDITVSSYGVYLRMENIQNLNDTSVTIGDIVVANNTISSSLDGIYVSVNHIGNVMYGDSLVTMGDFRVSDNVINSGGRGIFVDDFSGIGYSMYDSSSFAMGNLEFSNNRIDSVFDGLYLDDIDSFGYGMYDNSTFMMGSIVMNNNTITSDDYGIDIYYLGDFGEDMHGNSSFTMGHIQVNDNIINSGYDGIHVDDITYFAYYMEDNSSFMMGSIEFNGNIINSGNYGIYAYDLAYDFGYDMTGNSSFTMGHIQVNDNIINSGYDGIDVEYIEYFGYYMYGESTFVMGKIEFANNVINSPTYGIHSENIDTFGYRMYDNSTFMMGSIVMNNNTITSDDYGIDISSLGYFGSYMNGRSSFTMGSIEVVGNTLNCTNMGISFGLQDMGYEMYGTSSVTMGHVLVNGNVINSGNKGLYIGYIGTLGSRMYGDSTFAMGNIEFSRNEITSESNGIEIVTLNAIGSVMYNNATSALGDIRFNDNTISSGWYGIVVYNMFQFGWEMHGNSSVLMGNIEFCGNTINSTIDALGFGNFYRFGYSMYDNSSFSMGSVLVSDNTFYSYFWLGNFGYFGSNMYGNASFTMNNVEFNRNMIHSIGKAEDGIYFYNLLSFGNELHGNSTFTMGDFNVNSNTIVGDRDRFGIACHAASGGFGINLYDSASALTGSFEFAGNDISFTGCGFYLYRVANAIIRNNTVRNSTYIGIYLLESADNKIYHNNFINSTFLQAEVTANYNNTWDNGYPSGGNYWSDYTGTDQYSGPDQNIAGSDFRGDTPYVINTNNTDHYPLTIPFETQPPTIVILSPENKTYTLDSDAANIDIQLTFTLDELADWIGYSLDEQAPVTITGNTTLLALPIGSHHVTVYANDTFNNMGMSTVYFTVLDLTDPIADAGSDRTVDEDVSTTLDGSASTDNVGIASYTWTFTDVTVKTLTGDKPTYTFNNPGIYTITLNVTDAAGNWAIDTTVITVLDVTNPVANAGQDQTVNVGETVAFDAGSSTDNVGIVSYEWDFGDETTGTGKTATHEYASTGTYTVTLTVEDAAGNQATDTMVVTVNAAEAFPWWIVAVAGIVVVGIVAAVVILWRRQKRLDGATR